MKVIIHAGIHRTGTTSLQGFLADHRGLLKSHGVGYPGERPNHQQLAWALKRGDAGARDVNAIIEDGGPDQIVVLSAEDFCIHTDLKWLAEVARSHEVRAVFYLRRQDHWIMSWYNQHVKWPFDRRKSKMGKGEFLETIGDFHWLDYSALLGRWTAVLGAANVSAAVLEPGQVENVIQDFIGRLGISCDGFDFNAARKNDSLPVHVLDIARNLGLYELPSQSRTKLIRALRQGLAHKAQPARTVYSPEERNRVLQRFDASNRALAKRIFGRDVLFFEPPPSPAEPFFDFPDISREELIRDWIGPVVRELLPKQ
jgi:hypothetical protein